MWKKRKLICTLRPQILADRGVCCRCGHGFQTDEQLDSWHTQSNRCEECGKRCHLHCTGEWPGSDHQCQLVCLAHVLPQTFGGGPSEACEERKTKAEASGPATSSKDTTTPPWRTGKSTPAVKLTPAELKEKESQVQMKSLGNNKAKFEEFYRQAQSQKLLLSTKQRQFLDEAWETCGRISSFLVKGEYEDSDKHRIWPYF